jgi:hypothetical protein
VADGEIRGCGAFAGMRGGVAEDACVSGWRAGCGELLRHRAKLRGGGEGLGEADALRGGLGDDVVVLDDELALSAFAVRRGFVSGSSVRAVFCVTLG